VKTYRILLDDSGDGGGGDSGDDIGSGDSSGDGSGSGEGSGSEEGSDSSGSSTPSPTDEGEAFGPPEASTTALSEVAGEPGLTSSESRASQLLSAAASDGLSNPSNSGQGGWTVGLPEVDPYTNVTAASGVFGSCVGRDVNSFTNAPDDGANSNAYTCGSNVNMYCCVPETPLSTAAQPTSQNPSSNVAPPGTPGFHQDGLNPEGPWIRDVPSAPPQAIPIQPPRNPTPPSPSRGSNRAADEVDTPSQTSRVSGASTPSAVESSPVVTETVITLPLMVIEGTVPFEPDVSVGIGRVELGDVIQLAKGAFNGLHELLHQALGDVRILDAPPYRPPLSIDPRFGGAAMVGSGIAQNLAFEGLAKGPALDASFGKALKDTTVPSVAIAADGNAIVKAAPGEVSALGTPLKNSIPALEDIDAAFARLESGAGPPGQGAMLGDLMFHQQRAEAMDELRRQLGYLPGRPGRTPPGVAVNPQPGYQSAHSTAQSAMRTLPTYDPGEMITRFLPTGRGHAHTLFDQHWQAQYRAIRSATGRTTTTAQELYEVTATAARQSGAFSPAEAQSVADLVMNDLFFQLRLSPTQTLRMPGR